MTRTAHGEDSAPLDGRVTLVVSPLIGTPIELLLWLKGSNLSGVSGRTAGIYNQLPCATLAAHRNWISADAYSAKLESWLVLLTGITSSFFASQNCCAC